VDEVRRFEGGFLLTNAYLLPTPGGGPLLVDAPADTLGWLDRLELTPRALLLTHQHFDHVIDAAAIAARGVPILAWRPFSRELTLESVVREWGMPFDVAGFTVDETLEGRSEIELEGLRLELLPLPGHSPDSVVFRDAERDLLLAGDTLFRGSTGRGDLPGGDLEQLCRHIRQSLYPLPDRTRVLPGHGPETTIGEEKHSNPIVRA